MSVVSAVLYGIIQGLTEFLPVSSSGHLAIAHGLFGGGETDRFTFDILLHLATLVAVFIVYWTIFTKKVKHSYIITKYIIFDNIFFEISH